MRLDDRFEKFGYVSEILLRELGIAKPKKKQVELIRTFTTNITLKSALLFNKELTEREKLCLLLVAKGNTAKAMATMLGVKKTTVDWYKQSILRKLDCHNMAQAVFEGLRAGYISNR